MMRMKQDLIMRMKVIVWRNRGARENGGTNLFYEILMGMIHLSDTNGKWYTLSMLK